MSDDKYEYGVRGAFVEGGELWEEQARFDLDDARGHAEFLNLEEGDSLRAGVVDPSTKVFWTVVRRIKPELAGEWEEFEEEA